MIPLNKKTDRKENEQLIHTARDPDRGLLMIR